MHEPPPSVASLLARAKALSDTIKAVRRAQGKHVPDDFVHGSVEWEACTLEFARDLQNALAGMDLD